MCVGSDGSLGNPLVAGGVELSVVSAHRWLGTLWPDSLDFSGTLQSRLQHCGVVVSQLAGLVSLGVVTWPALCELFESKVDSLLDLGRWLFIMVEGAEQIVCEAYERWARTLLGAEWYRNAGTCSSELGCTMSGFHRIVLAVAMRRAKLWLSADGD